MKRDKVITLSLISGIVGSLLLGILLFFQIVIDDGFIFFKYGYNLIQHGVWSWSTNGKPI